MRKKYTVAAIAVLVCLILAACIVELEPPPPRGPWGQPVHNGVVYGQGLGYGGQVRVDIELTNGIIVDVVFDLRTETPMFTRRLPNALLPFILQANSFDFPDAMAGATLTNRGIKAAARQALLKIPGVTDADLDF